MTSFFVWSQVLLVICFFFLVCFCCCCYNRCCPTEPVCLWRLFLVFCCFCWMLVVFCYCWGFCFYQQEPITNTAWLLLSLSFWFSALFGCVISLVCYSWLCLLLVVVGRYLSLYVCWCFKQQDRLEHGVLVLCIWGDVWVFCLRCYVLFGCCSCVCLLFVVFG